MAGQGRLEDSDLVKGVNIWYLKKCGLWRIFNDYRETRTRNNTLRFWAILSIFTFIPVLFISIIGPFYTEKDLEGMTLVILNPLSALQAALKLSVLWYGIETQSQLLSLMKKNYMKCIPEDKKVETEKIMSEAVRKSNVLAYMGIYINVLTVGLWNVLPILRSEYFRCTLGITTFGTPQDQNKILGFWYPVDHQQTPWTQIVYAFEFFLCIWAGFLITVMESLIAQLVMLLSGYMKVIQYLMLNLTRESTSHLNTPQLITYVKEHQNLIRIGDEMRELYNFVFTVTLSTGLVILIISIFNFFLVTGKGDIVITVKFVIYTMYALVEVFVYCYAGMELENTSGDLEFAAYSCDWYVMKPEFRKTLQMMMVRSERPVNLKAGRLYPVNYLTLTDILRIAYSTSMILFRMTTESE